MQSVDKLNKEFALPGHMEFKEGPGRFIFADIKNDSASAELFIHGAQLTSFIPKNNAPVLFLSGLSNFEAGKAHYERALTLSHGKDLSINVDYARYYARTLYDRELHDRLLNQVMSAEPKQDGYTLFNTLAQREAQELLDAADEYF